MLASLFPFATSLLRKSLSCNGPLRDCTVTLVLIFLGSHAAFAQSSAARVMSVTGTAKAVDAQGVERALEKGSEVRSGEKIVTAEGALVQMRLNDGGYMSVRPSTEMVIDRFVYDEKNASNSNFLVSLLRGGFRSITGLIGKTNPDAYQIRAGTATVGIRGTDHEPMVIPEGLHSMAALGAPGIYDKVNDGETFIRNKGGVLSLKRGDVGFAPVLPDRAPQILVKVPDFYKVEIKTDARDPKDGAESKGDGSRKAADTGGLLRPSLAARKALDATTTSSDLLVPAGAQAVVVPTTSTLSPAAATLAPVSNSLSTSTLVAPSTAISPAATLSTTTTISPMTSTLVPLTTTLSPAAATLAPVTTTIVPISPTITPITTIIAPITTISPITTIVAPTTTIVAPTTTIVPKTTSTLLLK
jgi:hypothetical protein